MRQVRRRVRHDERGSGLLGSVLGVGILIALVGLAANVSLELWTRSTVDSVAYDAARHVATAPPGDDPTAVRAAAVHRARALLGTYGQRVDLRFEGSASAPSVTLRVRAPGVSLLPRMLGGGPVVGAIDRQIVVVREPAP